jgi:hypothetical protein
MLSTGAISAGTERRSILPHNAASTVAGRVSTVSGTPDFTVIESNQELHRTSHSRRRRVRCRTCSWCRNARISSWRAARECADVRRVWRTDRNADIIAQKRICGRPQHQRPQRERTFQQAQHSLRFMRLQILPVDSVALTMASSSQCPGCARGRRSRNALFLR